jgi:hypothetical protein
MFGWPEGITTWAILLTLLAIAEQTSQTRVAAEATREAAKAALLNAQAVINAERPWILVVIEPDTSQMGGFNVYFTNKGRTPAIVLGAFIGCAAVEDMGKLPLVATYGPGNMVQTRMVIHGERVWATWFDSRMFKQILGPDFLGAIGDNQVFVFGKVIYRDLLNPDTKLLHETRWIGLYQPPVGDDGGNSIFRFEGIGVSDEYERYT